MLQKWGQSTLLNSIIISDYSPNTSKTSTKLVCNQQVALRSNKYQEGRWQTAPSAEREPELALCHRHSRMTCTQQKGLPDPAVPQPLLVTVILQAILCLCSSSVLLDQKKKECISMKTLHNAQKNLEEHAEKPSRYSFPVPILSPWHNYQVTAGNRILC